MEFGTIKHNQDLPSFLKGKKKETSIHSPTYATEESKSNHQPIKQSILSNTGLTNSNTSSVTNQTKTIEEQRNSLPIYQYKESLLEAIGSYQILIVVGIGNGKTTQITQYLDEARYTQMGMIGCTQPRYASAKLAAKRVAEEYGCKLGDEVGFSIRFKECVSSQTKIKYLTDEKLLRECLLDPYLKDYSVVILDEVHERTLNTDVLFGLLKNIVKNRPDLKLIISSSTLENETISKFFNDCPIFMIPGRYYPVEIYYSKNTETDYLGAAVLTAIQIHLSEPTGDILLFLADQEEVYDACQLITEKMKTISKNTSVPELIALPLTPDISNDTQSRIFQPSPLGTRKVIVATNIAESSVVFCDIVYVVDSGFVKQKIYNPNSEVESLVVCSISKANAVRRASTAGRSRQGKCFRLYPESVYSEMLKSPVNEIHRSNLVNMALILKAMGVEDIFGFDFLEKPDETSLINALYQLYCFGALNDDGQLTQEGKIMAKFPLNPTLTKMILASVKLGCSAEILTIVSMLSVQTVFYSPLDKKDLASLAKERFNRNDDHLTLLAVFEEWVDSDYSMQWCFENFIQYRSLQHCLDVRKHLQKIMENHQFYEVSCNKIYEPVWKSIASGYFMNAAIKDSQGEYKTILEGTPVFIHPESSLFQIKPHCVVYHELDQTTNKFMKIVTAIEPLWLIELSGRYYKTD